MLRYCEVCHAQTLQLISDRLMTTPIGRTVRSQLMYQVTVSAVDRSFRAHQICRVMAFSSRLVSPIRARMSGHGFWQSGGQSDHSRHHVCRFVCNALHRTRILISVFPCEFYRPNSIILGTFILSTARLHKWSLIYRLVREIHPTCTMGTTKTKYAFTFRTIR